MPTSWREPDPPPRRDPSWASSWPLYLAVFAVTGLGVYRWGLEKALRPKPVPTYAATAIVRLRDGSPYAADPRQIREQIASKDNVEKVVRQLRPAVALTNSLRVTADGTSLPGEYTISITCSGQPAQQPARLVNALAESFAGNYLPEWKRRAEQAYAQSRDAANRAEQESLRATAELEQWSQNRPEPQALPSPTPAEPPPLDNPEWVEVNRQLTALENDLDELLINLTSQHPKVQDAQLRIAALSQRLSATPRWAPGQQPEPPVATGQASGVQQAAEPPPEELAVVPDETAQQLQGLREAADRASDVYIAAFRLEHQAWENLQQEPTIELDLARPVHPPAAPTRSPLALVLAAVGAGLAMATGLGMVSAGTAMQPPLTGVEQVRRVVPVPVVGTIPESGPASDREPTLRRRLLARRMLIFTGLLLIVGCAAWLLRAWSG